MRNASYGGNLCYHAPLWFLWLVLVIPQVNIFSREEHELYELYVHGYQVPDPARVFEAFEALVSCMRCTDGWVVCPRTQETG